MHEIIISPEDINVCVTKQKKSSGFPSTRLLTPKQHEEVYRHGGFVGCDIEYHHSLPRAMEYGKQLIQNTVRGSGSFPNGKIILAGTLAGSKGRFARSWHAPMGGLWGCLVHVGSLLDEKRRLVPLAVGLACCQTLRQIGLTTASIRWINDILVGGKKIAGFLVEQYCDPVYGEKYDLIGFGVNLNNQCFPDELKELAVSFSQITGNTVRLEEFCQLFLTRLRWNLGLLYFEESRELEQIYEPQQNESLLIQDLKELSDTIGQRVVYGFNVVEEPQYEASVLNILPDGGLLLGFDDGASIIEYSGEIRYCRV